MYKLESYEGNSVIARHEQEQARIDAINECDEGGLLPECIACGEHTVEVKHTCKACNNEPCTAYCISNGMRGCLYKITGRCQGYDAKSVCSRCGEEQ